MVSAADVQALNKKIESIAVQRTKAEARADMLNKQLEDELRLYKEQFGVNLKGRNFSSTKMNVKQELQEVIKQVEKEYNLKVKVVECIESGNYEEAYSLLGLEDPNKESEPEAAETPKFVGKAVSSNVPKESSIGGFFGDENDGFDLGTIEEPMIVEGDDAITTEEDAIIEEPKVTKKSTVKGTSVESAMQDLVVEGDDTQLPNLSDEDFGFGDMLKGSKFDI